MSDPDRVEQAATRIGTVLANEWTLDSLLGIGGMASVYAASAGRTRTAIKVLHPDLARSQRALDRFRREGEALRAARHAAVPELLGDGTTDDGCPYLVMELLLGETVEARRRRFGGKLAWAEVVQIGLVVLDVLSVIHARGLVHRDVKPSNVLWLDDGTIRLIDFGIAKTVRGEDEIALTQTGTLPGSLAFMSPEHALGVPSDIDARSDVWSLGASMFLLLSGRPVHESQTEVEALALSASRKARSLGSVTSDIPASLVEVVDRALAFDRQKRFAHAADMRAALLGLEPNAVHKTRSGPRRLVFAAIGLVFVGGAAVRWASRGSEAPPTPAVASAAPAEIAPEPTPPPVVTTAEPLPLAPPRQEAARTAPAPRLPPSASATTAPSDRPPCDPPFLIDLATGTRRVKPGCG